MVLGRDSAEALSMAGPLDYSCICSFCNSPTEGWDHSCVYALRTRAFAPRNSLGAIPLA